MKSRETAWRVFASELNSSVLEIRATEEMAPSYLVSPLGAKMNRVLIAGVMTEKENVGDPDQPAWRARIQDVSGHFLVNVRAAYQPEASAAMADLEVPCFVAAVARVRRYTTDDQRSNVSVRPERILRIDERTRREWVLETAKGTWRRLRCAKIAMETEDVKEEDLIRMGLTPAEASGLMYAMDNQDGMPDSTRYLKTIQNALRMLLPDRNIDLGFPEDMSREPDEIEIDPEGVPDGDYGQKEEAVLRLIEELDTDVDGAPRDELERRAEAENIGSIDLEEITNELMNKGLIYEPNLRYLKRV